jgi:hypothetical protein
MNKSHKPGCFGQSISHDAENPYCQKCSTRPECSKRAEMTLRILAETNDVSILIQRVTRGDKKKNLAVNTEQFLMTLPSRSRAVAKNILARGIDVRQEINNGSNPFTQEDSHCLKAPCELLRSGEFSRSELKQAYRKFHNGIKDSTISANTSTAISVLLGLNVVEKSGNKFRLSQ